MPPHARKVRFWLGDQLMSWDEYDGIKTALVGILSGGVSGYSMMHSDVGGYVMLKATIAGKAIPVINRTPQLFQRWAELNAFTGTPGDRRLSGHPTRRPS